MKKHLLFLFATLLSLAAHGFEVDNIYYNITSETDKTVEVTSGWISYGITLPATVTYNGVKYSVTSIGNYAFTECSSLTSITIPEGVTSIGRSAFYGCSSLTTITIPEDSKLTSIGHYAFYGCSSLTSITLPEGVTSIGEEAFESCSSLTAITIPEDSKLTIIGDCAFRCCSSLTAITIPEGVTSIGGSAFSDCSSLKTVINYSDLPLKRRSIGYGNVAYYADRVINIDEVIDGCAFKTIEGVHYLTGYIGDKTELTLPADYEGENYQIGERAFYGCSSLTAITIPEGVTSIGDEAFAICSSLTAITIPEGVTSIGDYAFSECSRLTSITIPESVTSIGIEAFDGCSSLERVTINCANVGSWFRKLSSIKEIVLGEGVTSIGDWAFSWCSSLTAITIPEGVTSIGDEAFGSCSSLKTVINYSDLPLQRGSYDYGYVAYFADRVINVDKVIDGYAFKTIEGVHYLTDYIGDKTELTLPADYKSENYQIGNRAFEDCSNLTAITIPESVTSIGEDAFNGCSSLERVTINCANVGSWFSGLSSIKEIVLGESVRSIEQGAFSGCSSLESLHIGPNVDSYGDKVFEGCTAIKELTVMGSVMPEIPSENITSITLYSPIPLETTEFAAKVYRNATLNIPENSLTRYENADVWKNFWYVNEFDPKEGKDIYLTINQADNGYVKQHLTEGTVCTFTIVAAEGWKIHSVTFNGEEVTAQLTEEGTFTTPALQADAVLNIAHEKTEDNTMVANTTARAIKVQGHQGTLRITGTTQGEAISVYTTDGMLVAQERAEGDETQLTLPTGQVYIVTVADKVVKIGM